MRVICIVAVITALLSMPAAHLYGTFLVTLEPIHWPNSWAELITIKALLVAMLIAGVPFIWLMCLNMQRKFEWAISSRVPFSAFMSLVLVAGLGGVYETSQGQWLFIESLKVRAEQFSLPRSMAFLKSKQMNTSGNSGKVNIALVGSSQINAAVDTVMLGKGLPGTQITMNALPGFSILQYPLILPELQTMKAQVVVCWLSEFDAYREDTLPVNRLRYFGGWQSAKELASFLGKERTWDNRSNLADIALSGMSPIWRDRDMFRMLAQRFWWPVALDTNTNSNSNKHAHLKAVISHSRRLQKSIGKKRLVDVNFRAFATFAQRLRQSGIDLYVFEGVTSPIATSYYDPRSEMRKETSDRLSKMAGRAGFTYITSDQVPIFSADDFSDAVHLNSNARSRFTNYLATFLASKLKIGTINDTALNVPHENKSNNSPFGRASN